jgi:POTRA domain, FtsQ-type
LPARKRTKQDVKRAVRRKRSTLSRLRPFWIAGAGIAALAAAGGYKAATLPMFDMTSLAVAGVSHVSADDVRMRAAIDARSNVWLQDRAAMVRRIVAIPYVANAHVAIRFPAAVTIAVAERVPAGCVRDPSRHLFTIDADRRILESGCSAPPVTYNLRTAIDGRPGVFLNNPELDALLADAAALARGSNRFRSFGFDEFGDLEATLVDGIAVRFGDDEDLARKDRLVGPILAELGPRLGTVRALDMRAPATPVVEFEAPKPRPSTRSRQAINTIYTRTSP